MHISEQFVAFPYFDVEKTVADDVPDVFHHCHRVYQRQEKLPPVIFWQLENDSHESYYAVCQDENHPDHKRQYKIVVASQKSLSHLILLYMSDKWKV